MNTTTIFLLLLLLLIFTIYPMAQAGSYDLTLAQQFTNPQNDSNGPYGENIFWGSGKGWKPSQAVTAWVGERIYYNHGLNLCVGGEDCGHYTQVVWKSTRRVGCAMVNCLSGRGVFMTCNYHPPGNYVGEKPY